MTFANTPPHSVSSGRSAVLDSARGLACLAVVNWHLMLAFYPMQAKPIALQEPLRFLYTSPLHILCNGQAAVVFFFVLSGCVLSTQFFHTRNLNHLHRGLIKRYPRLLFCIFVVNLLFSMIASSHGVYASESARLTESSWLGTWGMSTLHEVEKVSIFDAVMESLLTCFTGSQRYNSSLWTMRIEFLGSIFLMCSLPTLYSANCFRRRIALYCLLLVVSYCLNAHFPAFIVGALAADKALTGRLMHYICRIRLIVPLAILLLGLGKANTGWYFFSAMNSEQTQRVIHTFASFVLIVRLLAFQGDTSSVFFRVLSSVGNNSFALYLLHVPVILTITSFFHVSLPRVLSPWMEFLILASFTHCVSFFCAVPISFLDRWWCTAVERIVKSASRESP